MSKRSARMEPVVRLAEEKEREAARQLGAAQGELHRQQERLRELNEYRADYAEKFRAAGALGMDGTQLHSYRHFISQLDQAIAYQRRMIERAQKLVAQRVEEWNVVRGRLLAIGKVVERIKAEELAREEKREQGEADERAQHMRRRDD